MNSLMMHLQIVWLGCFIITVIAGIFDICMHYCGVHFLLCMYAYNKFESSAMTVIMKQYGHMI